jgi:hypothetical protein
VGGGVAKDALGGFIILLEEFEGYVFVDGSGEVDEALS